MEARMQAIVIGAGQAGLATSRHLSDRGVEHVVLERDRIAESWRSRRWDAFTLVTPAWTLRLPGYAYRGEPNRFLPRDEIVEYLEGYAESFGAPVRQGVRVDGVRPRTDGALEVATEHGAYVADAVVVATGTFQRPRIPRLAAGIPPRFFQVHASAYRRPSALPEGAVLVVGGGQSAAQIADDLVASGRDVYLSVGRSRRLPRTYRGRDLFTWAEELRLFDRTVDRLEDPAERFAPNPILIGRDAKKLSLGTLARDGVAIVGRLEGVDGAVVRFGDNLARSLEDADRFAHRVQQGIDTYIEEAGLDAPPPDRMDEDAVGGLAASAHVRELDLDAAGVGSIVWGTGFSFDFSWVDGAELDGFGYPVTERGVTRCPGLYFVGLHWLHTQKSGLFFGVGDDAAHIAAHIADAIVARG